MKKNIIIILISFCAINIFAQNVEFKYRPLSEFGTDTLLYLKTNFENEYFKGKPLGEVIKYYTKDLPIEIVVPHGTSPYVDQEGESYMESVSFYFYDSEIYWYNAMKDEKSDMIFIDIYFKKPWVNKYDYWRSIPNFDTELEKANYMKDLKVDYIKVYSKFKK